MHALVDTTERQESESQAFHQSERLVCLGKIPMSAASLISAMEYLPNEPLGENVCFEGTTVHRGGKTGLVAAFPRVQTGRQRCLLEVGRPLRHP